MSQRTLRRRLEVEGETYKSLVSQFRLDMTNEYFKSNQFNQVEISRLLGYSDANTFRRAFKAWTGQTVRQYHQSQLVGR